MYLYDYLQDAEKMHVDKLVELMVIEYNPPEEQIDYVLQLLCMEELMIPYGYLYNKSTKLFKFSSTNGIEEQRKLAPTMRDIEYGVQEWTKFSEGWLKEGGEIIELNPKQWLEAQFEEEISVIPIMNKLSLLGLI